MNGARSVGRYSSGTKMEGLGESQASAIVQVGATMEESVQVGWLGGCPRKGFSHGGRGGLRVYGWVV